MPAEGPIIMVSSMVCYHQDVLEQVVFGNRPDIRKYAALSGGHIISTYFRCGCGGVFDT